MSALALASVLLVQPESTLGEVTGTVAYRERMALPPTAELVVSLDEFREGSHINLTEVRTLLGGKQVPIQFKLPYLKNSVKPNAQYGVRARILVDGTAIFESTQAEMVITNGKTSVEMMLRQPTPLGGWKIEDRTWGLVMLEGQTVVVSGRRPTLRFSTKDNQIAGFSGVNGFGGTFELKAPQLQIDPGAMTMMAGSPEQMQIEQQFLRVLPLVNRVRVESGDLVLLRGEKALARFTSIVTNE